MDQPRLGEHMAPVVQLVDLARKLELVVVAILRTQPATTVLVAAPSLPGDLMKLALPLAEEGPKLATITVAMPIHPLPAILNHVVCGEHTEPVVQHAAEAR